MPRLTWLGVPHLPVYHSNADGIELKPGESVDVSDSAAERLLRDFPGVFVAAHEQPEVDRQIKSASTRPVAKRAVKK